MSRSPLPSVPAERQHIDFDVDVLFGVIPSRRLDASLDAATEQHAKHRIRRGLVCSLRGALFDAVQRRADDGSVQPLEPEPADRGGDPPLRQEHGRARLSERHHGPGHLGYCPRGLQLGRIGVSGFPLFPG